MQRQSLIFRLGEADRAGVEAEEGTRASEVQLLDKNGRLDFGIGATVDSIQENGLVVTRRGLDLLVLASAVYAADKRLNRAEISQDGWTREIDVHIPVYEPTLWNAARHRIGKMLGFLTGDLWRLAFRPATERIIELAESADELEPSPLTDLCLFSGGLDSFIGAVNLLAKGRNPLLVSHSWAASDSSHQHDCLGALIQEYGEDRITQVRSRIGFGEHDLKITKDGETTERSRSFLFFCIAAAAASGLKALLPTIVPENGFISLNIALDPLRLGAFSTRTTHPYFMARFNELLSETGLPTKLENPYRHRSKGEMVADCLNPILLRATVAKTVSCSSFTKARWEKKGWRHCGHCVPCLIRRAALLAAKMPDPTSYTLENLTGKNHPSDHAEGEHIRSFQLAIHRLNRNRAAAPILVQKAGSLADRPEEIKDFAEMYCRGLGEVEKLLQGVRAVPHV
jgi:7-cyano-7-deazaguanine synthase in queuosine biosynthesis